MEAPASSVGSSHPAHPGEAHDGVKDTRTQTSTTELPFLEKPSVIDSASWYNIPWKVVGGDGRTHDVPTRVASQSEHSVIHIGAAKSLGLTMLPTTSRYHLIDMFGGECIAEYSAQATVSCPEIGRDPVQVDMLVVNATEITGQLLVGTNFTGRYRIFGKIEAAKEQYAGVQPSTAHGGSNSSQSRTPTWGSGGPGVSVYSGVGFVASKSTAWTSSTSGANKVLKNKGENRN